MSRTWLKDEFDIHVTQADIDRSNASYRDTSYTNPIAKAISRQLRLAFGQTARVGSGYGTIYTEDETITFHFIDYDGVTLYMKNWILGRADPRTFAIKLDKVRTLSTTSVTPKRYGKPSGASRSGM